MNWYVLHVHTGQEVEVQKQLRAKDIPALAVRETVLIRRGGSWTEQERTVFPGYVFVYLHYTAEMHHVLKAIPGTIRLLPQGSPQPLYPHETAWLLSIGADLLTPSTVDFSGLEPVVLDGPLKQFEEYIVKYHRRQRRVSLRIPLLGYGRDITLAIQPVPQQQKSAPLPG